MAIKKTVQDDYLDWCQENMKVFRWVDMQMGRQVDGQIGRWVDSQMGRQVDRNIVSWIVRQEGGQSDRYVDSWIERWIVRQICGNQIQVDTGQLNIGGELDCYILQMGRQLYRQLIF